MNFFYNYIRKKLISQSCQLFSAAHAGLGCGCSSISRDAQSYRTSPQPPAPAPLGLHWYLLLVRHVPNTSPRSCPCRATSSGFLCCGGETGPLLAPPPINVFPYTFWRNLMSATCIHYLIQSLLKACACWWGWKHISTGKTQSGCLHNSYST